MGQFLRNIATESVSPAKVSLANNPNFIEWRGIHKTDSQETKSMTLTFAETIKSKVTFIQIRELQTNITHTFAGQTLSGELSPYTADYYYSLEPSSAAQTLKNIENMFNSCHSLADNFAIAVSGTNTIKFSLRSDSSGCPFRFETIDAKMITRDFDPAGFTVSHRPQERQTCVFNIDVSKKPDDDELLIEIAFPNTASTFKLKATNDKTKIDSRTVFVADDNITLAENIRNYMLRDTYLRNNFDINIVFMVDASRYISPSSRISVKARGEGKDYAFSVTEFNSKIGSYQYGITGPQNPRENDYLQGDGNCQIEMEVYADSGIPLGHTERKGTGSELVLGTYLTTLTKAYNGTPIWFDINTVAKGSEIYNPQPLTTYSWCNPGTMRDYSIVAKRFDGIDRETFYISDILYTVNGYDRTLEANDLSDYVYQPTTDVERRFAPLTKMTETTHIKGQTQFFNFIYSRAAGDNYMLGLKYRLMSQSGIVKKEEICNILPCNMFSSVNSIKLDLDSLLARHDNIGRIEVFLCRNGREVSMPLTFNILPHYLYQVKDFAFLNSLGGWSSFNFAGTTQNEFKAKNKTIFKTFAPKRTRNENIRSQIESVFSKEIEEQFMAQTMPVNPRIAEWLKELNVSAAVYEMASGRYVIVDDVDLKYTSKDDLVIVQMKYRYSDSYR